MTENPYQSPDNVRDSQPDGRARLSRFRPVVSWALLGALSLAAVPFFFGDSFSIRQFYPTTVLTMSEAFMWYMRSVCVFGVLGAIIGGAIGLMIALRKK